MGMNFFLHTKPACECCGRPMVEPLHIGKSSAGWCFALHVIPEKEVNTLDDWRYLWAEPGSVIRDEYGDHVSIPDMELVIAARGDRPRRRDIDGEECLGHGPGPWDYVAGEFS